MASVVRRFVMAYCKGRLRPNSQIWNVPYKQENKHSFDKYQKIQNMVMFCQTFLRCHDFQCDNILENGIQHNNKNDTPRITTFMLRVVSVVVVYAECRYCKCRYVECYGAISLDVEN